MDDEETKICSNCKRDIPVVNFLVHTVHCDRNIKVCPTCKEPVPQGQLKHHQDSQHASKPCKACGESVSGSDLEDHVRDSCALTVRPCRFCELELPRRELPLHEGYCGSRTEQCPECREWVMIKYRQLHVDSNHGFIKLDDEPPPLPRPSGFTRGAQQQSINAARQSIRDVSAAQKADLTKRHEQRPTSKPLVSPSVESTSNGASTSKHPNRISIPDPATRNEMKFLKPVPNTSNANPTKRPLSSSKPEFSNNSDKRSAFLKPPPNFVERPSSNMNIPHSNNLPKKQNGSSERRSSPGLLRPVSSPSSSHYVPPPKRTNDRPQVNTSVVDPSKVKDASTSRGAIKKRPAPKPPSNPTRDLAYYSAMSRYQDEEKRRREINAYNLANGLPPILNPAEKLEKLRKMDALHNREVKDDSYKNRLQGRCWGSPIAPPVDMALGTRDSPGNRDSPDSEDPAERNDLKNLKPMTQQQFLNRFQELQLRVDDAEERLNREGRKETSDRFSEIKSSLRELRRGLNEVTAPYNSPQPSSSPRAAAVNPPPPPAPANNGHVFADVFGDGSQEEVSLPCEFCDALVPADDLVQHQTGCRPDLIQYRPSESRSPSRSPPPRPGETVIPCEFCTESLPVYLIIEHQERCRREGDLLFPD